MDCPAICLHYPAIVIPSPYRDVIQIYAAEFRGGPIYRIWRPQGPNDWLFIYTVGGCGRLRDNENRVQLVQSGDCALYEPGAWQHYETDSCTRVWHLLWARFRALPHWLPRMAWPSVWPNLRMTHLAHELDRREIKREMRYAVHACQDLSLLAPEFALNAMDRILLRIHASTPSRFDSRIIQASTWLTEHIRAPFSVAALASVCGMSPSHLAHLFRKQTGTTPQKMLEEIRMRRASQLLLSTKLPVAEIARAVGYENAFYFTRRFQKFWNASPTSYRASSQHSLPKE